MYDAPKDPDPASKRARAGAPRRGRSLTAQAERKRRRRRGGRVRRPMRSRRRVREYQRRMAEIDRLGDEIAVLSAQIQAATYELLVRLREFDQREGWGHHGAKSCAHWLAWRTSLDPGAAREWVRVARALEHLPAALRGDAQGRGLVLEGAGADPDRHTGDRCGVGRAGPRRYRGAHRADRAGLPALWTEGGTREGPTHAGQPLPALLARRGRDVHSAGASRSGGGSGGAARDRCRRRGAPPGEAGPPRNRPLAIPRPTSSVPASAEPTRWSCSRSRRSPAGSIRVRPATATRSSSTSTPRCSRTRPSRESPASPTVDTFPRKRLGDSRATPRPSS